MQEVLEQIIEYLKGIWIKRRYIIVSTWLICPIGWYIVAQLPNVYKSEAKVYVDTQSLLRPLLRGLTIETNPDMQINLMVKTLLSRPNLKRIARMTDLDVQATTPELTEKMLTRLKDDLKITKGGRENIYTIAIEDKNPKMAKNIVQSALTVFIENTLGETRNDSDSAQKFLDTQLKEYESRLLASEAKLADFKQKYSDVLPNQSGGFYAQLNSAKDQLKSLELEILENKTKLKSAQAQINVDSQTIADPDNKIKNSNSIQTTYDSRIADLEATLDGLLLKYTDQYPDVVETKRRLAHLNELRAEEIKKYLANAKDKNSNLSAINQSPVLQDAQIQVNQLQNAIASLEVRAKNYRQRVADLESKIHTLPEIEAELVALNRGYDITKKKYEELLNRKETAQLAQSADETTDKIQFRVIDPARVPLEPSGPPRVILFVVITILGIGVGIGLSLLMSQIAPVATSPNQLTRATGIPIFGTVTANETLNLHSWHRRKSLIFIASNLVLFTILVMLIAYFLFPDAIQAPLKRIF